MSSRLSLRWLGWSGPTALWLRVFSAARTFLNEIREQRYREPTEAP
ncbi:MAG: hypothetical protein NTX57_15460 [Armatimonadetes bacterium]|nr:hypothetical protein [Armatimonadota bacterium]